MTMTTITADTITDRQILDLRREARNQSDDLQVAICTVALATGLADVADIDETQCAALEGIGIIPEHVGSDLVARALCADAVNEARAMDDSQVVAS
jgi:hypothetical protein